MIDKGKQCNEQVDVWSLGIVLFELLVGKTPFEFQPFKDGFVCPTATFRNIKNSEKNMLVIPKEVTRDDARDLIEKLLKYKPSERLRLTDFWSQPWIVRHQPRAQTTSQTTSTRGKKRKSCPSAEEEEPAPKRAKKNI
jgi:serine/threonine protein kinase